MYNNLIAKIVIITFILSPLLMAVQDDALGACDIAINPESGIEVEGDVGSENNLTKSTGDTKVKTCLDNQDLMLPEPYIMLWDGG